MAFWNRSRLTCISSPPRSGGKASERIFIGVTNSRSSRETDAALPMSVDVVSVEASKATKRKNEAVRALLRSHGFEHVMTVRTWAPKLGDEIFLHERVSHTEEGRRRRKLWRAKMLEARLNAREAWL